MVTDSQTNSVGAAFQLVSGIDTENKKGNAFALPFLFLVVCQM